jgi:hypothetical protein
VATITRNQHTVECLKELRITGILADIDARDIGVRRPDLFDSRVWDHCGFYAKFLFPRFTFRVRVHARFALRIASFLRVEKWVTQNIDYENLFAMLL